MSRLNVVILEGVVIGDDPVSVKEFNGKKVVSFRLVSSNPKKDADGNWQKDESAVFINCFRWDYGDDKICSVISDYIKKGAKVIVQGSLIQDTWEDKDGHQRSDKKIKLEKISILSWGGDRDDRPPSQPTAAGKATGQKPQKGADDVGLWDENVPF